MAYTYIITHGMASYGKLWQVNYKSLFKYDVISVLDIMLNNEANKIKKAAAL